MDVLNFFTHLRGDDGHWSGWERDELSRLKAASASVLDNQIWEDGVTDNGDPWMVAVDEDSLELSLHVARLSGAYVAVSGDLLPVSSSANLKSVVNDCLIYIRSNRQEAISNDGATIRMPVGVSAAAFGIFLTERMTTFDEPQGRVQANLKVNKLGLESNESFVFLSSLAKSSEPQVIDPVTLAPEGEAVLATDQFLLKALDHNGADQAIVADPSEVKRETDEAQETDVASVAAKASADADLPAPSAEIAEQSDVLPLTTGDTSTAEVVQVVEGPSAQMVVAGPAEMVVGEDKIEEELAPDQSDSGAPAVIASASPMAPEVLPGGGPGEPAEQLGDAALVDFASLDYPASSSEGEDVVPEIWLAVDLRDDVFAI